MAKGSYIGRKNGTDPPRRISESAKPAALPEHPRINQALPENLPDRFRGVFLPEADHRLPSFLKNTIILLLQYFVYFFV